MASARSLVVLLLFLLATLISAQNDFPTLTSSASTDSSASTSSAASGSTSNTDTSSTASTTATSSSSQAASSSSDSSTLTGSTTSPPALTSSSSTDPNLPTLAGVLPPPLIVPDTSDAPYMQHSNLPEGTVFICVGAVLAFLGSTVLAWRGMVAYSLHRSVKRAAIAAYTSDTKSMFPFSDSKPRYSTLHHSSSVSLEQLSNLDTSYGGAGQTQRQASRHMEKKTRTPTSSSLFFSPTGTGLNAPAKHTSGHLPSGFYAQGASAANSGDAIAHFGGGSGSNGYNRVSYVDNGASTPSPPDSPGLQPSQRPSSMPMRPNSSHQHLSASRSGERREQRRSKLGEGDGSMNIASPPQGRAPSAYLEGLMDSHGFGPRERF